MSISYFTERKMTGDEYRKWKYNRKWNGINNPLVKTTRVVYYSNSTRGSLNQITKYSTCTRRQLW